MTPLEMIAEWRKGCSVVSSRGVRHRPEKCEECTLALINAIEARLKMSWFERLQVRWRKRFERTVKPSPVAGSIPHDTIRAAVTKVRQSR